MIGSLSDDPNKATEATTTEETAAAPTTTSEETIEETTEASTTEAAPPPPPPPRVAAVSDGDTIRLEDGRRVRLVQIDAPERRRGECFAQKSAQTLRRLLGPGTTIRLAADPRLDKLDRFGRQLRYVFLGRRNVNIVLVRQGAAAPWFFNRERGRYADLLMSAAEQAQAAGRGLWGACSATKLDPFASLVAEKPPSPAPPPPAVAGSPPATNCHPSYKGACLDPNSPDYDCAGGSGNGPDYTGYVTVVGYDEYGLDSDGDGIGCEDS